MLGLAHVLVTRGPARHRVPRAATPSAPTGSSPTSLGESDGVAEDARVGRGHLRHRRRDDLRDLARRMAAQPHAGHRQLGACSAPQHGEQPVWMGIALAALLGQIGLPGGGFGHGYGSMADVGAPHGAVPAAGVRAGPQPGATPTSRSPRSPTCSSNPGGTLDYDGTRPAAARHPPRVLGRRQPVPPPPGPEPAAPGASPGPTPSSCTSRSGRRPPATPTSCCRRRRSLERDDVGGGRNDGYVIAMPRAIEPVGEARDDYEAFAELAKRLDVWDDFTEGRTARDWVEHIYERFRERVADARRRRCPPFDEFWAAGEARLPVDSDDHTLFDRFRADPDGRQLADAERAHRAVLRRRSTASATTTARATRRGSSREEWLGGDAGGALPAPPHRQPAVVAPARPARRRRAQPGHRRWRAASRSASIPTTPRPAASPTATSCACSTTAARASPAPSSPTTCGRRSCNLSTGAWFDPVDPSTPDRRARTATRTCSPPTGARRAWPRARPASTCSVEIERYDGEPPPVRAHRPPRLLPRP